MVMQQLKVQVQKQILAPVMRQSIEVLMLSVMELELAIENELESNPLLEVAEPQPDESPAEDDATPFDTTLAHELERLSQAPVHPYLHQDNEDDLPDERPIKSDASLEDVLCKQLHIENLNVEEIAVGEFLISSLDEDGYLTISVDDVVQQLKVSPECVEKVLKIIQSYEPIGIAARDLKECLMIQAKAKFNGHAKHVMKIIDQHLDDLGRKRYQKIAKKINLPVEFIRQSADLISQLDPKPARNYRFISNNPYIKPDVFIYEDENAQIGYRVELKDVSYTPIRISSRYKALLERKDLNKETREYIREHLTNAIAFIKSLSQRGQTLKEIAGCILERQKDFFRNGYRFLRPMTLRDVATVLGRNESTISRAITNKYIDTPQGLFPLKYFFSTGVGGDGFSTPMTASRSIKEELQDIIDHENVSSPLSDEDIKVMLGRRDIQVSRRTIAKYRQQLHILPSHLRKV